MSNPTSATASTASTSSELPSSSGSGSSSSSASRVTPHGIMFTNDDGPPSSHAPYLLPFLRQFKQHITQINASHRTVTNGFVCVPTEQQSWLGKSITRYAQVISHTNWDSHAHTTQHQQSTVDRFSLANPSSDISLWSTVDGSPATAVNVGLHELAPQLGMDIDLVISGPNFGRNTGRSLMMCSGTLGAALEAAMTGRKAIAVSIGFSGKFLPEHVSTACSIAVRVVSHLWQNWPAGVDLFNVNIPIDAKPDAQILTTHILQDELGHAYRARHRPQSHSTVTIRHEDRSESSTTIPDRPTTLANTAPVVEADVPPLTHSTEYDFFVDFTANVSHIPGYVGSDLWAIHTRRVSVTPLTCTLTQVPLAPNVAPYPSSPSSTTRTSVSTTPSPASSTRTVSCIFPSAPVSPPAGAYIIYLGGSALESDAMSMVHINDLVSAIERSGGTIVHRYTSVFKGVAARISEHQAQLLQDHPAIAAVQPDSIQQLHTSQTSLSMM